MKARKKPVVIDFFDVHTEQKSTVNELKEWVESFGDKFETHFDLDSEGHYLKVKTLEGTSYDVSSADMILRGVSGEYYPCKKDIFEKTYDVIEE